MSTPPPLPPLGGPAQLPAPGYPPPPAGTSNATLALILGIVGVVSSLGSCCCCLFLAPGVCSPIAWYLGRAELAAIRAGRSPAHGEGEAKSGMILGIVGTCLLGLYVLGMIAYVAVVGLAVAMETLKSGGLPSPP